jgi:DNA-binding CsgD family transcriptional regulator
MNEPDNLYLRKYADELFPDKDTSSKSHFYYPLMPLQFSFVHNLKTDGFENVQGIEKVLGYPDEEFTIKLYFDNIHPIDRKLIIESSKEYIGEVNEQLTKRLAENNTKFHFETQFTLLLRIKSKSGEYKHILQYCSVLEHCQEIKKTFSVCTDVTFLGLKYKANPVFHFQESKSLFNTRQYRNLISEKWQMLTLREIEILELITKGNTSKKISEKLNISILTVNKHRQNIINKTSKSSIKELINEIFYGGL